MIWIEDHKNMVNIDTYKGIFKQMQISNSDYMNYTWWFLGKVYKMYSNILCPIGVFVLFKCST